MGPPKLPKSPGGFQRQAPPGAQATPGGPAGLYLLGKINRCWPEDSAAWFSVGREMQCWKGVQVQTAPLWVHVGPALCN